MAPSNVQDLGLPLDLDPSPSLTATPLVPPLSAQLVPRACSTSDGKVYPHLTYATQTVFATTTNLSGVAETFGPVIQCKDGKWYLNNWPFSATPFPYLAMEVCEYATPLFFAWVRVLADPRTGPNLCSQGSATTNGYMGIYPNRGKVPLQIGVTLSSQSAQSINWGDGTTESVSNGVNNLTHTYSAPGKYTVTFTFTAGRTDGTQRQQVIDVSP